MAALALIAGCPGAPATDVASWAADPARGARELAEMPDPVEREALLRAFGEAHPDALPALCDHLDPGGLQERCRVVAQRPHLLRPAPVPPPLPPPEPPRRRPEADPPSSAAWPGGDLRGLDIEVVRVEPGSFLMGSPPDEEGRQASETQHRVTLTRAFLLARTELTQRQWRALTGTDPSRFSSCGPDCPVDTVTWYDAVRYCNRLSELQGLEPVYSLGEPARDERGMERTPVAWKREANGWRLPTEAEWEYAARAGEAWLYAGSNEVGEVAWYDGNAGGSTHPAGTLRANAWGLHDMSANVFEWCWDVYGDYTAQEAVDPLGPAAGTHRVSRGGSWYDIPRRVRVADRYGDEPDYGCDTMGFRLARNAP